MAPTPRPWTVDPHDAIERIDDNLWTVEGDIPRRPLRRRMTLVRLADGRLVIHNAVALGDDAMREIEAWGEPAVLIVPNHLHRLDAHAFKLRYPSVRVLCPAASHRAVAAMVAVDGHYDDFPGDASVRLETLDGSSAGEGVLAVRSARDEGSTTLVFNDTLFNVPHRGGFAGTMLRLVGSSGGPRVTPIARAFVVGNKRALAAHLARLAETPGLTRVIPGHGDLVREHAPAVMRGVAARLG